MKYDIIVAIDPDTEESGVARLDTKTRSFNIQTLPFPELLDYLQCAKEGCAKNGESLIVLVEAGWVIQSNWHLRKGDNARIACAKGNSTGRNHETGRKIVEMCKHYEIEVLTHFPLKKHWKGKDGKITHEELAYFTGIKKRTNQDARDAALLAWNFAGFPIRMKV